MTYRLSLVFTMGALAMAAGCSDADRQGCGNGIKEGAEVCDGKDFGDQSCQSQGLGSGSLSCSDNCDAIITATCDGVCGNGSIEGKESCDGSDFGDKTCETEGFVAGTLSCKGCTSLDTSGCVAHAWKAISAGGTFTCAIDHLDRAWCWGSGEHGELGHGEAVVSEPKPVKVLLDTKVRQISAGWVHACAVDMDGQAWCWGANDTGQLGDNSGPTTHTPVKVVGLDDALQISAGAAHSCAVRKDLTLWCWGLNSDGQLGDGTDKDHSVPNQVPGQSGVVEVACGSWHSCARTTRGNVLCWGDNPDGQVGDGSSGDVVANPQTAKGISGATQIAVGEEHSCAVDSDNALWCWGYNADGQLGTGTKDSAEVPVLLSNVKGVKEVSAGIKYSCALELAGKATCWGDNAKLQLGISGKASSMLPVEVSGSHAFDTLECGEEHCCALAQGLAWCWGENGSGQLGDGSKSASATPLRVIEPQ